MRSAPCVARAADPDARPRRRHLRSDLQDRGPIANALRRPSPAPLDSTQALLFHFVSLSVVIPGRASREPGISTLFHFTISKFRINPLVRIVRNDLAWTNACAARARAGSLRWQA